MEKRYYKIKEVSDMLSIPMSTLRYWEHEVDQLHPTTNEGRRRFYTEHDIQLLRQIQYLRTQNVPVSDLSKRLRMDARVLDKRAQARANLIHIREELTLLLKNL